MFVEHPFVCFGGFIFVYPLLLARPTFELSFPHRPSLSRLPLLPPPTPNFSPLVLSYQDSNLERLNQNQLCYHYTIAQSAARKRCKDKATFFIVQIFWQLFCKVFWVARNLKPLKI